MRFTVTHTGYELSYRWEMQLAVLPNQANGKHTDENNDMPTARRPV